MRNKQTFDNDLAAALGSAGAGSTSVSGSTVQPLNQVSVIALDVDHFKQVNDTFGHLYGDILLQAFSRRLSIFTTDLERELGGRASISLARTGGEEFAMVISGDLSRGELDDVAERVRQVVANLPVPSEQEWDSLMHMHTGSLELPPTSERHLTTSIGIATANELVGRGIKQIAAELKHQADTALYRAKSGGRNVVRRFSDILGKHGTILEHHPETGIVAIDIGRQVRVAVGQEFLVYHPDFTGDRPFVHSDGRTKKRLGGYPRYPCGRIVAFDVQPEVSFCEIVKKDVVGPFPVGSALEVVPVGAISHLIRGSSFVALDVPSLLPTEILTESVQKAVSESDAATVLVVGLDNVDELTAARGTAFINRALAALFTSLRDHAPSGALISQLQATQFAVILVGDSAATAREIATSCIASASEQTGFVAKFRAGFAAKTNKAEGQADQQPGASSGALPPTYLLEFARYAAAPLAGEDDVNEFTPDLATAIVLAHYRRRTYPDGLADFRRLRELGLEHADLENAGALCALGIGDSEKELALEAIGRAMQLDNNNDVFRANAAYIQYQMGDRVAAAGLFASLESREVLTEVYLGPLALSFVAALQAKSPIASKHEVQQLLSTAINSSGVAAALKLECARALSELVRMEAETIGSQPESA